MSTPFLNEQSERSVLIAHCGSAGYWLLVMCFARSCRALAEQRYLLEWGYLFDWGVISDMAAKQSIGGNGIFTKISFDIFGGGPCQVGCTGGAPGFLSAALISQIPVPHYSVLDYIY